MAALRRVVSSLLTAAGPRKTSSRELKVVAAGVCVAGVAYYYCYHGDSVGVRRSGLRSRVEAPLVHHHLLPSVSAADKVPVMSSGAWETTFISQTG